MTPSASVFPPADGAAAATAATTTTTTTVAATTAVAAVSMGGGSSGDVAYVLHTLLVDGRKTYTVGPQFKALLLDIACTNKLAFLTQKCLQMDEGATFLFSNGHPSYLGLLRANSSDEVLEMARNIDTHLKAQEDARKRRLGTDQVDADAAFAPRKRPSGAPRFFNHDPSDGAGGAGSAAPVASAALEKSGPPPKLTLPTLAGVGFATYAKKPSAAPSVKLASTSNLTKKEHVEYLREVVSAYREIQPGVPAIGPEAKLLEDGDTAWDAYDRDTDEETGENKLSPTDHITLVSNALRAYRALVALTADRPEVQRVFKRDVKETDSELKKLEVAFEQLEEEAGILERLKNDANMTLSPRSPSPCPTPQ
jgi:hypothetical protein